MLAKVKYISIYSQKKIRLNERQILRTFYSYFQKYSYISTLNNVKM